MYESILSCLPSPWTMDIKIHPLAAKYHDYVTNIKFLSPFFTFVKDPLLKLISNYEIIVSFGSSSFYELSYFNKTYYNLSFIKNERSQLYKDNDEITINTKKEFIKILKNTPFRKKKEKKKKNPYAVEEIIKIIESDEENSFYCPKSTY